MKVWSRSRASVAIAAAALLFPANAAASDQDASRISEHTRRSTAYVAARVSDRTEAVGAGVIIAVSPNVIVLTARHLAARKNLALRTFSGEQLRIVAEYEVADRDVALIVATGPCTGCEAAETADAVTVGEAIHVWGNPQGRRYVRSDGTVADLRPTIPGYETNGRIALACDTCDVGDSGGGVFDQRGRLLGIVTEGWDGLEAGRKRVIAEPANHALAHLPLAYIARSDAPPRARHAHHAARAQQIALACEDPGAMAIRISAVLNARALSSLPALLAHADSEDESVRATRTAMKACAKAAADASGTTPPADSP